ncbi:fumarylacetoacetate hydrolase family protein [Aeromicrobium alkaliterrae]|uniref:Fumarylacetoacetate hydrolase family protein n=1 Tax=Aeromicrobium alkaliterrae TaxID=302168 RepID=A0ABP4W9U9_9ACTN
MRLARVADRFGLVAGDRYTSLAALGIHDHDARTNTLFDDWEGFRTSVDGLDESEVLARSEPLRPESLQQPVGYPRQIFALALNYADHAAEAGAEVPEYPLVFPKYPSSVIGPADGVVLGSNRVDWEVELVVVVGRGGFAIPEAEGWGAVAGLTIGQDLSDRRIQARKPLPHFALAKSGPTYAPVGPYLVTPDELENPDDLAIRCEINGEVVQSSRTSQLIFDVPRLVAEISSAVRLEPGDLIFTGTPAGVGASQQPRRYLEPDAEIVSVIEGIGSMTHHCTPRA